MAAPDSAQPASIEPSRFEPLDSARSPQKKAKWGQRFLLIAGVALFAVAAAFVLSARSLEIRVNSDTAAKLSLSGLALPLGNRYLVRPGEYELTASAAGYTTLLTQIIVDERSSQSLELELQPLPGLLVIESEPDGAIVFLNDEPIGVTPLTDYAVAAGSHLLRLEVPRYLAQEQSLEVTGRQVRQHLQLTLAPAWADLQINSEPAGASVLVDGERVGATPMALELLQGEHSLTLQLPTYRDWQQDLVVQAEDQVDLGTVQMQSAAGTVAVTTQPSGANVTLDGVFQGQTPITLELKPEHPHRVDFFKPGFQRHSENIQLAAAQSATRDIVLRAELGKVDFQIEPPAATLFINGKSYGKGSRTLSLPAIEHRVEVRLAGHASVTRRVTPRPGLAQRVQASLLTTQQARVARNEPTLKNSVGQTLLLLDPAQSPLPSFSLGASRREPGRRANEVLRPVALERPFYLSTTEVTNAQFRQFQANHKSGQVSGQSLNRESQPVVQITWQQAASYCNWLSRREKRQPFYSERDGIIIGFNSAATGYRLPSEAEWAWAARASGSQWLKFPWGETYPPSKAVENYADAASAYITGRTLNKYQDGFVVSAPVASFSPNQHGLYDMGGNVAEWVNDVYSIATPNAASVTDPLGAATGDNYVIRGASWSLARLPELRLAYRDYGQAGRDDVGFRIARYGD